MGNLTDSGTITFDECRSSSSGRHDQRSVAFGL
jgi:hypothetical protein